MKRLTIVSAGIVVAVGATLWLLPGTRAFFKSEEVIEVMPAGRQFYVSPEGTPQGDGTMTAPWDLATALDQPASIVPGDVVNLLEGTYRPLTGSQFFSRLKGVAGKYILVHPQEGQHAIILGGVEVDGPWVIFRDLEVSGGNDDRESSQDTSFPTDVLQSVGFNVFGGNVKIVNNIIHDNAAGVDSWAESSESEFYGNLIYYNGWKSTSKAHGQGVYMQNLGGKKYVRDNVIFSQFSSGMQFYGSEKADLNNFVVEGNIVFNNGVLNNEHARNILVGGGKVARNLVVRDNYMYFPPEMTLGGDHNLGYNPFGVGCSNLTFTGNYIATDGPALNLFKCTVDQLRDNTLYGELKGFTKEEYPNNQYFDRSAPPRGVEVFVRPNRFEAGRAHIAIFNWNHVNRVDVDVAQAGLTPGDRYEIRSVQDYFGDVQRGTYEGKPVQLNMVNRSVAQPKGVAAPPSTFPEFGAFVIRKDTAPALAGAAR